MTCTTGAGVTSGFIDLATYDNLDRALYGGKDATTYFIKEHYPVGWFTKLPTMATRVSGNPAFGQEFSVGVPRSGDYVLNAWLTLKTPEIKLLETNRLGANGTVRWTKNLMHNAVEHASLTFNDICAQQFNTAYLDAWTQFNMCEGKRIGYDNMIGNTSDMTNPTPAQGQDGARTLPSKNLVLPLPFFSSRDCGLALPTVVLPYNEIRINIKLRSLQELLVFQNKDTGNVIPISATDIAGGLADTVEAYVYMTVGLVSNVERCAMAGTVRDMVVEQMQAAPTHIVNPQNTNNVHVDMRFSHAVKALFFMVQNVTYKSVGSNYTCVTPVNGPGNTVMEPAMSVDPIKSASLTYENTTRLANMGVEYYSLVQPWYFSASIPVYTGYHMYSYALNVGSVHPSGSTNYGRLTNASITVTMSPESVVAAAGGGNNNSGYNEPQRFALVVIAVNHNVIRIMNGSMGFPIL
ncbi:major capsid protein [Singapore grouper iridovirus]|nr:major capsid protein [Singapore grouper iridovirus]